MFTHHNTMAFLHLPNAFLFLILCTFTLANPYPPAEAPHHHHYHHHHHNHPPPPPPSHPPVKSPYPPHHHNHPPPPPPPSHPPTPPPSHPPVKPPYPPHHHNHPPPPPPRSHPPTPPPSHPPVKPPAIPPVKPPAQPPVKPPTNPPRYPPLRKLVAVQGVVYCKPCKYRGVDTVMGATPLTGAVVKLQCNNTKYGLVEQTKTDKNGYFLFLPQKLTTAAFHKCKVFLVSSPVAKCRVPTNFHSGVSGAVLIPSLKLPVKPTPFQFFNVGPFAFEPHKNRPCPY